MRIVKINKSCNIFRSIWIKVIYIFLIVFINISINIVYSQENNKPETDKQKRDKTPIKHTFEALSLVNSQTTEILRKNSLQFNIQHRFGRIDQGFQAGKNFDLLGILGVSNIRVALNYGITNRLTVGLGAIKNNYLYDLRWKYKILQQTKTKRMPLTLLYFGNASIKTYKDDDLSFIDRLTYFHELIIARKFNKKLSLQLAPSFSYFNIVDTLGGKEINHANFGVSIGGRVNVSAQGSIIFEYNHPLTISDYGEGKKTKPVIGIGFEIATRGHAFQLFLTNAISIIDQYNMVGNTNDFFNGEIFFGFNISRRWSF